MTLAQFTGLILLLLPFVVLFIGIAREEGVRIAFAIFGGTFAITGVIMLGCFLLLGTS